MKQLLIAAALLCVFASPSLAAKLVYLKDGSIIQAKNVWRSKGMVHVLVNRDTLADFNDSEVNLKKTFIKRHKTASPKAKTDKPIATAIESKVNMPQAEKKKTAITLPTLPSLPEKSPAAFAGKEEGSIRKHKREMAEKAGE